MPGNLAAPAEPGNVDSNVAILIDGTHVRVERSGDSKFNKKLWSGKKKAPTYNTNIITSHDGIILGISKTVVGSTHDITLLRDDFPNFGMLTDVMFDVNTPPEKRPTVVVDSGYQGLTKYLPGANVYHPIRRDMGSEPEGGLSQKERDYNREVGGIRITIEHAIGRIKQYRIMTKPYHGTTDQLNDELNVVTGLVNFKHMWGKTRQENMATIHRISRWRG